MPLMMTAEVWRCEGLAVVSELEKLSFFGSLRHLFYRRKTCRLSPQEVKKTEEAF